MIVVQTPTQKVQIILAGAKNTNDAAWVAAYDIQPSASSAAGFSQTIAANNNGVTNGVTAVDVIPSPGAGYTHRLRSFILQNADLAAITISFLFIDSTGSISRTGQKIVLQTLENLYYEDGVGFIHTDANGAVVSQAAATSSATSTAQLLATSAWSVLTQINAPASVLSTSVQASSLALAILPASVNSVSSQASSMAAQNPATVSSLQSAASVQSFTSTNWATISSATSRVKSSFTW